MYKFPERLKSLMLETTLTQKQLSEETKLSQAAISRWLSDNRRPGINELIILAQYFKCSIDYLVGLED